MSTQNTFESSRRRLRWAKEYIAAFNRRTQSFFDVKPYATIVELDDQGIFELHKVRLTEQLPEMVEADAVTGLENLRAALDNAAYAVADSAGVANDKIHFPFCKTAVDFKSRINSACKDFPHDIQTLFGNFQPYSGGDDLLWALNELCNSSKHRIVVPVVVATTGESIMRCIYTEEEAFMSFRWDSAKNEMLLGGVKPGCEFNYNFDVTLGAAFGEVKVVQGQPVARVLDALFGKVTSIVDATEAECRRIGLIA